MKSFKRNRAGLPVSRGDDLRQIRAEGAGNSERLLAAETHHGPRPRTGGA